MFRGLKGRLVLVNLTSGEGLQGTVSRAGWFSADLTGLTVIDQNGPGAADGYARVRTSAVVWVQVL